MRVHENIKRFARNYATLFIVFFACALYQMPVALVGLLASLALWGSSQSVLVSVVSLSIDFVPGFY